MNGSATRVRLVLFLEPSDQAIIEAGGEFCCESEPSAARIIEFCRRTGKLPYSRKFVSLAVIGAGENICESEARMYGDDSNILGKTRYGIINTDQAVLESIDIVGRNDLRQLLTQLADRWKQQSPSDSLLRQVKDLRGKSIEQKWRALRWSTTGRGSHGYSEARLNRCLTLDDVCRWGECD